MLPILFRFGPFDIRTHDVFVLAGIFVALAMFLHESRRQRALDQRLAWIAIGSLLCGALAAKLSTVWQYVAYAPEPSLVGAVIFGGKSILGGLAGAYVGALLTKRIVGYTEKTGDLFAPAVAAGMAVGRIGCFLSEQLGTPTSLPWGISVDTATAARMPMCSSCAPFVAMHPSFLYEVAFHALACAALVRARRHVPVRGDLFKLYLLGYGVFRFLVEFVRGNPPVALGLSYSQLFLIPTTLLLAGYFVRQFAKRAYRLPPFTEAHSTAG